MSFKDIKGQDDALTFLKDAIANGRISHAYIFLGPSGVGKKLTALNFAKALNCLSGGTAKTLRVDGCDNCASCNKIDKFNHPDLFMLSPEKRGASIKIDGIRSLIKDIYLKPYEARKKIYIIDESGSMTQEAENALLKTLEEPPSDSVLILIAEDLDSLFQTIVSRAQVIRFFPLRAELVGEILKNRYSMDSESAHTLAYISSGKLGEAIRYKESDFFGKREAFLERISCGMLLDSEFEEAKKEDLKLYLDIMLGWYRDLLVAKTGGKKELFINRDKAAAISQEAAKLKFDYLKEIIDRIILTNVYLDQNVNQKLAMSVLGLALYSGVR